MSKNIKLVVFGTFGNPNGFKQSILTTSKENQQIGLKTFDLKTDAITLFPNSKIYSVRKEVVNGVKALSYSVYSFAKERNSNRGGTFIGSSIIFCKNVPAARMIIDCLNDLQNTLFVNNVAEDTILVNHSDKFTNLVMPRGFNSLENNVNEIPDVNFRQFTNNSAVIFNHTNPEILQDLFERSVSLLNIYDTVFFTENADVKNYVQNKRIFRLMDSAIFDSEIQKIKDEKLKRIESAIEELNNERSKFENEKQRNYDTLKIQIDQSERTHQENKKRIEESRNELNQFDQKYNVFFRKIDELTQKLAQGGDISDIRQLHGENRRRFIDSLNQQSSTASINKIDSIKSKGQSYRTKNINPEEISHFKEKREKTGSSIIFIGTSIMFFLLWLGTILYFLYFKSPEIVISSETEHQEVQAKEKTGSPMQGEEVEKIEPLNNAELGPKAYVTIAKKLKYGMDLTEVVDVIFNYSPSDIKANYEKQKEAYKKLLLDLNKNCFIENGDNITFQQDTLRHIPYYKKQ